MFFKERASEQKIYAVFTGKEDLLGWQELQRGFPNTLNGDVV